MTKVTWLGDGTAEENTNAFGTFKVGEAVDVNDKTPAGKDFVENAKQNRFFKVAGNTNPDAKPGEPDGSPPASIALGAVVRNAAFGSEEELRAHRETSEEEGEANEELQAERAKRGPGRPRKEA